MDFLLYTIRSLAYTIVDPILLLILAVLSVLFYLKNKKISVMQKMIIGESLHSPLELTISQIVMGILGGILGTVLLSYLGVVFDKSTPIMMVFILSIGLMFIKPRFICFTYSSAALAVIGLLLTIIYSLQGQQSPIKIDVVSLFSFVGVLHIVEGLLVMIDADKGTVPVFTKKDGNILGGFAFKRYWPVPIAVFIVLSTMQIAKPEGPSWWPLISSKALFTSAMLIPYYGVMGFNSVTFTRRKVQKKLSSGIGICIYGIVAILLAQIGRYGVISQILVVFLIPMAHEAMIYIQLCIEKNGKPAYLSDDEGIAILELAYKSQAYRAGVKSGEKIVEMNGEKPVSEIEIYNTMKSSYTDIVFKIKKTNGDIREFIYKPKQNKLDGMVLVPKTIKKENVMPVDREKFDDIFNKAKDDQK